MREQLHISIALRKNPNGCFVEDKNFIPLPEIERYFFALQETVPPEIFPFPRESLLSIAKVKLYIITI
jgi:hypothetical protein